MFVGSYNTFKIKVTLASLNVFGKSLQQNVNLLKRQGHPADTDCEDEEHCEFKQIKECDFLQHLKDGWAIAHKLSDGEVIIKRT